MMVCLDTNIVIYYVGRNPAWAGKVDARLRAIVAAGDSLAVSDAARLECLVGPFQSGDASALADYLKFFSAASLQTLPVTAAVWQRAAQIRATYKLQPLDSVHLASAVEHGCGLFLSNDSQLKKCRDITVEILS